ncbi:MAG: hypothetical protein ACE5IW_08475 [bacterium]
MSVKYIEDYSALIEQKDKIKDMTPEPDKDPMLKVLGSVEYGDLTKDIDNALYGE